MPALKSQAAGPVAAQGWGIDRLPPLADPYPYHALARHYHTPGSAHLYQGRLKFPHPFVADGRRTREELSTRFDFERESDLRAYPESPDGLGRKAGVQKKHSELGNGEDSGPRSTSEAGSDSASGERLGNK